METVTRQDMEELQKALENIQNLPKDQQKTVETLKVLVNKPTFSDLDWEPKKAVLAVRSLAYLFEEIDEHTNGLDHDVCAGVCGILEALADKVEKVLLQCA